MNYFQVVSLADAESEASGAGLVCAECASLEALSRKADSVESLAEWHVLTCAE
jgi:hypothetical protein